jgi:DNA invertase Pin-like site-specific DNA recombinase
MRLTQAGAIRVFTDVRSGRTMDRPGLDGLLVSASEGDTLAVVDGEVSRAGVEQLPQST